MKKAREIFQEARQRKKISLRQAAEKIKIPQKYLEAIEKGEQDIFPDFHYAQLYVRDYARFLGLSDEKMVSLFRRDWEGDLSRGEKKQRGFSSRIWEHSPLFSRSALLVFLTLLLIGGYLFHQYWAFNSPPPLKTAVSCLVGKILIKGKTGPQVALKIEGKTVSLLNGGEFTYEIFSPWPKAIVIQAISPAGKVKEETIEIKCSP